MPTNRYTCKCGNEWTYIGPRKPRPCPGCEAVTEPKLPTDIEIPLVMEVVDKARNVKWRDNFRERAKKRNKFYNDKTAKEIAREHHNHPSQHGITDDDAKMI